MKGHRSIAVILGFAAAAAFAAVSSAATFVVARSAHAWCAARGWAFAAFEWVVSRIKVENVKNPQAPRRALIGAAQFLGRMMRRERPLVSPRWRLCPSV